MVKKAAKRLYFLVQLKRSKVPTNDLVLFYTACIRFIMDYAAPVFHHALPQYLMNELTRVEKRAMYIIFPKTDYKLALEKAAVVSVLEHHKRLCDNLFKDIVTDPSHKLYNLLPSRHKAKFNLRHKRFFNAEHFKTNRAMRSFVPSMCKSF